MKKILLLNILLIFSFLGIAQVPAGYYDNAQGFGSDALKTALYNIIKGHKKYPYTSSYTTDVWDILKQTDKDTNNNANVICFYSGFSRNAALEYDNDSGWTREHIWPKSHGAFDTLIALGAGTDAHHLRPSDNSTNTMRNNRWYAECSTPYIDPDDSTGSFYSTTQWLWEPRAEVKGDAARMIFYMATRYQGENGEPNLQIVDYIPVDNNDPNPIFAKLSDLLAWNAEDPVDDWERNRNDIIYYDFQHNRNPFIDHPEWVECIWNNNCSGIWFTSVPVKTANDRIAYSYNISASGEADLVIHISSDSTFPAWLTFTPITSALKSATASLTGSPALSDTGIYPIYLLVSNGTDTVHQNFEIVVTDGNPIKFTSTPKTSVYEGELYSYNITASGDAGANFTLTGTKIPSWLSLTNNTGASATLSGTPSFSDVGSDTIILTLTDNTKKTITQKFVINVSIPNNIIISQYYEGTSNNKYIEITNLSNEAVDLSSYYLGRWKNTDAPSGVMVSGNALSGTIEARQTILYKNLNAANPAYAAATTHIATEATYFNGNDPVALLRYGNTWDYRVDCIYAYSPNGTIIWGSDKGFYRKADVLAGNKNMSVLDGTGEWVGITIAQADDAVSGTSEYLGFHNFNFTKVKEIDNNFSIYPNPVKSVLYFENKNNIQKIEIVSLTGKTISQKVNNDNSISVESLQNGLYILKLSDGNGKVYFSKFVKQ